MEIKNLNVYYGNYHALKDITAVLLPRQVTAIIGPSGCGKSTLLRCLNRMNDIVPSFRMDGEVLLDQENIYDLRDLTQLRKRVGMVVQRPNPFPLSVFENIAYGPKIHGISNKDELAQRVQESLEATGLWKDLKDKLSTTAFSLSAEQQQRLCISRLLAVKPDVLLMDEPCSALDPIATAHVEELILELKQKYLIVIVTHNMQQASRISNYCGFMWLGELVEFDTTAHIFTKPKNAQTEGYVTGRFG